MSQEWVVATRDMLRAEMETWGSLQSQFIFLQEYSKRDKMLGREMLELIKARVQRDNIERFCHCVAVLL